MLFKISLLCIVITALFYNGLIFIANRGDISNPNIPFALKVLKDVVVCIAIFLPLLLYRVRKELKMPRTLLLYLLCSVGISLLMIAIALVKYNMDCRLIGILKNYLVYYPSSVVLVFLIHHYKKERYFFNIFRLLMFLILWLGLLLYFAASEDMLFTYSGRMISSLSNPNYLGYLSLLYILVLFGFIYYRSKPSFLITVELIVAHIGLFLSLSYAAILCYVVIMLIMFIIWILRVMTNNRRLIELIIWGTACFAIGSLTIFLTRFFKSDVFSVAFEEKINPLSKGKIMELHSVQVRTEMFSTYTGELFSSLKSFLFGTFRSKEYIESDSAFLNLAYNFGIPVFIAWLVYFIVPVCFAAISFKKVKANEDFNAAMTFILSIFIASSLLTHFWLQYLPEKFPTCLFIGFTLSYILVNSLYMKQSNETSLHFQK